MQYVWFGVLISLVVWASIAVPWSYMLQKREALSRERINLIQLQQDLLVPSEVIYYDPNMSRMDLAEVRFKCCERYGIKSVLPYLMVRNPRFPSPCYPQKGEGPREYADDTLENWWMNHLGYACDKLLFDIEHAQGLGEYLKQNPEVFDAHIRPLVVRLLDAVWYPTRLQACEVLLAMGDRSEEVLEIILLCDFSAASGEASTPIIKKYGLGISGEMRFIEELRANNERDAERCFSAWKCTHEIVSELKKKYPLQMSAVIQDWDGYCLDGREDRSSHHRYQ